VIRKFNIRVTIDTSKRASEKGSSVNMKKNGYDIFICKEQVKVGENGNLNLLTGLLHELGHVVATEMSLPGAVLDPTQLHSRAKNAKLVLDCEEEAWDMAELVAYGIKKDREACINSYKKQVKDIKKLMPKYILKETSWDE
jgi:hypothetical protein